MRAREPEYLSTVKGVSREEISLCEQGCGVTLPKLYVDFLLTMGADCGRFRPFGATQACNFYDLIEQLPGEDYPGEDYPPDRYYKIAFESDPGEISPRDLFLDLQRVSGEDAPLVRLENGVDFELQSPMEVGFTLHEWLNGRSCNCFDVRRRPQIGRVYLSESSPAEAKRDMQAARKLLSKMGLKPALPPLPRVSCLRSESLSVLLEIRETGGGISMAIGAEDRNGLGVALEQIVDGLPGDPIVDGPAFRRPAR